MVAWVMCARHARNARRVRTPVRTWNPASSPGEGDRPLGRCPRGAALEGVDGGKENSLAMTLLWFFVWLIANLIGDEEGLTFDPVNFWAGWLLLALALDLAAAHATRAAKAGR